MPNQKFIYILWQSQTFCAKQKDDLHSVKLFFCAGSKDFEEPLNAVKFLSWLKNILGPVKGQGIGLLQNVLNQSLQQPKKQKMPKNWSHHY